MYKIKPSAPFTKIIVVASLALFCQQLHADALVCLFLRPYPVAPDETFCKEMTEILSRPGKVAEYCLYGPRNAELVNGIFATYGGFLTISDETGFMAFPRRHTKKSINILITPQITPMFMAGNTLHHWFIEPDTETAFYTLTETIDQKTNQALWDTKKAELPENGRIPLETIVILLKPRFIYVPEGVSLTTESSNLVLPDIYVKQDVNKPAHALKMLRVTNFFGPLELLKKQGSLNYSSHVLE
jgi:hypothetical protein